MYTHTLCIVFYPHKNASCRFFMMKITLHLTNLIICDKKRHEWMRKLFSLFFNGLWKCVKGRRWRKGGHFFIFDRYLLASCAMAIQYNIICMHGIHFHLRMKQNWLFTEIRDNNGSGSIIVSGISCRWIDEVWKCWTKLKLLLVLFDHLYVYEHACKWKTAWHNKNGQCEPYIQL